MGIIKTWNDWQEDFGQGVGSGINDLGTGIANAACNILSKYTNTFPVAPYARGFVRGICGNTPTPLPDFPPPFNGGQCAERYAIFVDWQFIPQGETEPVQERDLAFNNIVGPIEALTFSVDNVLNRLSVRVVAPQTGSSGSGNVFSAPNGSFILEESVSFDLSRSDGQPDDCGDPPPDIPPDPEIDPNDFSPNISINDYDDNGNITGTNEYNVDFGGIDFGSFDFSLDVGGVNVNVDLGGFNIGGGAVGDGGKGATGLEDALGDLNDDIEFNPEDYEEQDLGEEEDGLEGVERLDWVTVDIVVLPSSGKVIVHSDPQDNDYFAGYISFTVDLEGSVYQLPAMPIRKQKSVFKAPGGATGFRTVSINGASLTKKAFFRKEQSDVIVA